MTPRSSTPAAQTTRTAGPTIAGDSRRGGTVRYTGLVVSDGNPDPHKSQSEAFVGHQSLVYSRLLAYRDMAKGDLEPDLAMGLPQQPDAQTLVFELRGGASWPDKPPYNSRPLTADDVKISIERQLAADPGFAHRGRWQMVERIEIPDPRHVSIRLKEPYAPAVGLFADASGYIVPAELASGSGKVSLSEQPGSGPFRWVEWSEGQLASVARNPAWSGGDNRPFLDGVAVVQARDADAIEAKLRIKELDAAVVGRPAADRMKAAIPALVEQTSGSAQWFGMRFYLPIAPYNDSRLRTALSIAIDRREMLEKLFAGSGELNPWISWPLTRWSLPQGELLGIPGHRVRGVEREADVAEARRLLAASLSDRPLPGELVLYVPTDIEASLGMATLVKEQVKRNLDLNVSVQPVDIGQLIGLVNAGTAPWVITPDNGWLDLDDWLFPYFHTQGAKNSFPLRDSEMDSLIASQRAELDASRRREIGYAAQRRLLNLNAGVNLVSERVVTLSWPYVKEFPVDVAGGYQHRFANTWLDRTDANFRGR